MSIRPLLAIVLVLAATACERPGTSVVGSWTAADPAEQWTLEMGSDSTYAMQIGTMTGEGTFTAAEEGEDVVQLQVTGDLAQVMPGGFRAHVERDTLRLCNVRGCMDMVRVQDR
jgi:hypothetical protein